MEQFVSFDDFPKTPVPISSEFLDKSQKYIEEQIKKMDYYDRLALESARKIIFFRNQASLQRR